MAISEIFILGEKLTIKGDATVEQVQELSRFIDSRIQEVCSKYPNIPTNKTLILTLYNIAEELHKLQKDQESITRDIGETARTLAELFE